MYGFRQTTNSLLSLTVVAVVAQIVQETMTQKTFDFGSQQLWIFLVLLYFCFSQDCISVAVPMDVAIQDCQAVEMLVQV